MAGKPKRRLLIGPLTPPEVRRERERQEQRSKLLFEAMLKDALLG